MGVLTNILSGLFTNNSASVSKTATKTVEAVLEEMFGGVPLSKLNEIALSVYHGIKVTVDQYGFLVFHYTSNSGKTKYHPQIEINELGKLVSLCGHYPGQWWSSTDEFVKRANEIFTFEK